MSVELQRTMASLRRQADALGELQRRWAELRAGSARSHAQLDAAVAAIDAGVDECLRIAEVAGVADPAGEWSAAVSELERQLRRLGVLRSRVLALYIQDATPAADGDGRPRELPR